jgi:glycyl-tRNA synthetase beta chain
VPLVCSFEERFLAVPQEALISTMQDNQKYFCLLDATASCCRASSPSPTSKARTRNSSSPAMRKWCARASPMPSSFFTQDKKSKLETRNERLKNVVFQAQLGSVYEKAERVSKLAGVIAAAIGADRALGERAGLLSKCDLATEMVGEFPELQGIAGYYYATHDGEHADVAKALDEQYQPRFAGDALPTGKIGAAVAIADKIDTLVGIFGINQPPTGSKDPFALRRSAIGLLRIIIEKQLVLDVQALVNGATKLYGDKLSQRQHRQRCVRIPARPLSRHVRRARHHAGSHSCRAGAQADTAV